MLPRAFHAVKAVEDEVPKLLPLHVPGSTGNFRIMARDFM